MAKKVIIRTSIRHGVRGPRLRLHAFFNGISGWSIIFSPNETMSIYKLIDKHLQKPETKDEQRTTNN